MLRIASISQVLVAKCSLYLFLTVILTTTLKRVSYHNHPWELNPVELSRTALSKSVTTSHTELLN